MDDIPSFGAWLKRRRKALDLTQDALAQLVGCSVVSIRKFEGDEQRPSRPMAERLAAQLQLLPEQHPAFVRYARGQLDAVPPELPTATPTIPSRTPAAIASAHSLGNLPTRLASFIGRATERRELRALLQQPDVRLVTLTGPGGAGKTSLALQVATALAADHRDGVWFVDLAPISDPDLVATTIAQVLEVREVAGQPLIERLRAYMRDKQLLLVLDNFEQVVAAAPLVSALLAAALQFTALATSREPLHLAGEREYAVQPLQVPDPHEHVPLEQVLQSDAVQLFVTRAQAVKADFAIARADAPTIAAIYRQLDGLPLAIELAAARVKLLPLPALLARLDQRLTLLSTRARDVPQRQQTMQATIDWSYQLLEADEQALFRRLGVFVGGWTLAAAEAVCFDDRDLPLEVLDRLAALVDKSLITQQAGVHGEPRFSMLETIRAYAMEQLVLSRELAALQQRHAEYFLKLVEAAEPHLIGPDQARWFDDLDKEYDNIRAVMFWSITESDHQETGLRIAIGLPVFWALRKHNREGMTWTERLLQQSQHASPIRYARALLTAGTLAQLDGLFAHAIPWLEEGLLHYRALNDTHGIAESLTRLGHCKLWQADYTEAMPLLREAITQFENQENTNAMIWAILGLGDCLFYSNQPTHAAEHFQKGFAIAQSLNNPHGCAWGYICMGRVAHALHDMRQAERNFERALSILREIGVESDIAFVVLEQARVFEAQQQTAQAYQCYAESLPVFARQHLHRVPECLEGIASLSAAQHPTRAAQLLGAATTIRESAGMGLPPVYRAAYEQASATARDQLGEAGYAAAYAFGQTLALDEAVKEALEMTASDAWAAS